MQEHLDQLIRVYNTLLTVSTKGEDTVVMGQCLSVMRDSLAAMQQNFSQDEATA